MGTLRIMEGTGYGTLLKELENLNYRTKRELRFSKNSLYAILTKEKATIEQARVAIRSGDLLEIQKVINLYLKKVTICREREEAEISALPEFFVMLETQVHVNRGDGGEALGE